MTDGRVTNEATFKVMVDSMATMATMAVALTVVMAAMMAALVAESGRCVCDGGVAHRRAGLSRRALPRRPPSRVRRRFDLVMKWTGSGRD